MTKPPSPSQTRELIRVFLSIWSFSRFATYTVQAIPNIAKLTPPKTSDTLIKGIVNNVVNHHWFGKTEQMM